MAQAIGTIGQVDSITMAGRTFTSLSSLIYLYGYGATAGTLFNCSLRLATGSSGYVVTSAKTFTVQAVRFTSSGMTAGDSAQLNSISQSDNDVGYGTATALTNGVNWAGSASGVLCSIDTIVAHPPQNECQGGMTIAAGKYITSRTSGANVPYGIFLLGLEA